MYPTRISVAWTASVDNVSEVAYTLFVDGSPCWVCQTGSRTATAMDLSPSTTYVFRVTASDQSGNVAESNVLSVTTPAVTDTVPPTVPANLRLSSESTPPEIWLDWDQSTGNSDPQSQIRYELFINGDLDHSIIGYGETITYCHGEGPNAIVIRAVDTSGNASAFSNEIIFDC